MKLDEIARLAGVSRTTASYVINGKAKQYRVSDKTVERVMSVVKEHNYYPNAVAAGLRAGRTHSIGLVIPDLENTSYTRIANYLERKARQCGYQLLIACSEDQPDNETRCIEHLLKRQVDAIIVSTALAPEHPFYQRWTNRSLPIIALDRALEQQHFISVVGDDLQDAKMLATELHKFSVKKVLYLGALPELSVSLLREQGFRESWQNNSHSVTYLYASSYERHAAEEIFAQWLNHNEMPEAFFTTSFSLLQGVMDVMLKRNGQLANDIVIATFGDNELLDFFTCPVLSVVQRHQAIADKVIELVLASLSENNKPSIGVTRIQRDLCRRGSLSRKI